MSDELTPGAETVTPEPVQTVVEAPIDNTDTVLGDAYDRLTKETLRDELGRFAADGTKIVSPEAGTQDDGATGAVTDPPVAGTLAPAHLPQAIKAEWATMTETARTAVAAHQAEMDRKFGEVGRQLETVKPFADTLSAAMKQIPECAGMSPTEMAQAAIHLAAVQSDMNKNPVGTIMEIAQTYGILPQLQAALTGQEFKPGDSNQQVATLQREIAGLKTELQKVSNPEFVGEQITKTMAEKEAGTVYQNFISDEKRKEFHGPAVEALLPTMLKAVLDDRKAKGVGISQADLLAEAYDMAINALPDVRAKVRAAEAKATGPDPKHAEAARKAVSINIKPTTNGKDAPLTEDQAMSMAYDRAMAN